MLSLKVDIDQGGQYTLSGVVLSHDCHTCQWYGGHSRAVEHTSGTYDDPLETYGDPLNDN